MTTNTLPRLQLLTDINVNTVHRAYWWDHSDGRSRRLLTFRVGVYNRITRNTTEHDIDLSLFDVLILGGPRGQMVRYNTLMGRISKALDASFIGGLMEDRDTVFVIGLLNKLY
jgi:hypothetical protein